LLDTIGITVPKHEKNVDGNGHGTHVAATISGKTFGVAKSARVHAVKVLRSDGTGSLSDVIRRNNLKGVYFK
jgi:cerevisin